MLRFNEVKNKYEIYPYKVKYINKILWPNDEEKIQWALPNVKWWEDTAKLHSPKIKIKEFIEIPITEDMQKRFKEIDTFQYYDLAVKYIEGEELPTFITDFLLGKVDTLDQAKLDEYYEIS